MYNFSNPGRSHNGSYNVFSLGKQASAGLKTFIETGRSDVLEQQRTSGDDSIFDEFSIPTIGTGGGRSEGKFFVDGNHSMVSMVARIVPSPDWFIGVDSFQVIISITLKI